VATTANSAAVLPTTMADRIWDLMEEQHSILGDVTIYRTGTILEVPVRSAITQGDAASVNENAANSDETNTFTKVTLSGKDFSKHVDVSYALDKMSIDGFEQYLTNEIAERLGAAMAADVITQIGTDMASGNAVTAAAAAITYPEVASAFAKLERVNEIVVYARSSTIYSQLVGMVDLQKRPIFQIAAQDGPAGYLIGAKVKREDAVADGVLLIGDPKRVVYNMVQDIMIETDRDIKKHVKTYSGYARGQGKLVDSKSFAKLTPASTCEGGMSDA
jgi:HK97 family phage major capsid protein